MKYALNLDKDNRILSVTYDEYAPASQPRVDTLPAGNVCDYLFIDGGYVYDPLPQPEPSEPEPTQLDMVEAQALYTAMMTGTLLEV